MKLLHTSLAAIAAAVVFAPADGADGAGPTSVGLSILGVEGFTVTMPYSAGHTINEAEAKVLNQTRKENLGNNFRARVKAYLDATEAGTDPEFTVDQLTEAFREADSNYVFTIANVGSTVKRTPEEREARNLAKEYVKQQLDLAGRKLSDVAEGLTKEQWDDALEAEYERLAATEEIKKLAAQAVKARAGVSKLNLGALGVGGETASAA